MENHIKIDDLGFFPLFLETPTWIKNSEGNKVFRVTLIRSTQIYLSVASDALDRSSVSRLERPRLKKNGGSVSVLSSFRL